MIQSTFQSSSGVFPLQMPKPGIRRGHLAPHELYSKLLKGGYIGDYVGITIRVIKGDTRSLDNGPACNGLEGSTPEQASFWRMASGFSKPLDPERGSDVCLRLRPKHRPMTWQASRV